jgi:integrase
MSHETSGTVAGRGARRRASAGRLYKQRDSKTGKLLDPWWIDYSIRGRRYRESSKTTVRAEAVKLLRQRLGEHGSGRYAPNAERVTLNQLVEGLRTHYRLKGNRSLKRAEIALKHVLAFFGGETLAVALTASELQRYAVSRMARAAAATAKFQLACLRKAMTAAVKNGLLATRPAFPDIEANNTRAGFFETDELQRVLAELPEPLRAPTRFAAVTGWRKEEVLGLTWDRVDFAAGVGRLDPDTTKNDDGRTFPFGRHPELADLLREQRAHTEAVQKRLGAIVPWVFHREGKPIRDCHTAWRSACRRAGCPGRIFHDLRRTAVRALERAGVARSVATKLTGHKTEAVYRRYAIVSESDLGDGVAKLARAEAVPSAPITPVISLKAAAQ